MIALDDLSPAVFEDKETFAHFSNPDEPNCFACNSQLMVVRPIEVRAEYLLMPATTRLPDGSFRVIPWGWQVYPRKHITRFGLMPYSWMAILQRAAYDLGLQDDFNSSTNIGGAAGQSADHVHTWLVKRSRRREEGLLSEGLGLATILTRVEQHGIVLP